MSFKINRRDLDDYIDRHYVEPAESEERVGGTAGVESEEYGDDFLSAPRVCASCGTVDYEGIPDMFFESEEPVSVDKGKLAERMEHLSDSFSEYLLYLIREKEMTNAEVYKRALVDKKTFSKIKNNEDYHPNKLTALCLCVGARLNPGESKDLLARAGYAFSPCDKTDIIFSYFIENEIYDMIALDIQLEEHGLPCVIA